MGAAVRHPRRAGCADDQDHYGNRNSVGLAGLTMVLVAFLSVLMVSTLRFTSLKSVGTGRRNARIVIATIGLAGLIYLYSRWVLLLLVVAYVVHGLVSRVLFSLIRRSPERQSAEVPEI